MRPFRRLPAGWAYRRCRADSTHRASQNAALCRSLQTGREAPELFDHPIHGTGRAIGCCHDEVELLAVHSRVPRQATVDERLHLGAHRVKIHRGRHDDHVGIDHPLKDLGRIILLRARTGVAVTVTARDAVMELPIGESDGFNFVSRAGGAFSKMGAKRCRVPRPSRAEGKNQDFLLHIQFGGMHA